MGVSSAQRSRPRASMMNPRAQDDLISKESKESEPGSRHDRYTMHDV
jgi:hypothetical protein